MGRINSKNIFLTGGLGFIGKNFQEYFSEKYCIFSPSHKELDLLDEKAVFEFVKNNKIDIIVHCANVGGGRDSLDETDVVEKNLRMFFNIAKCSDLVEKIIHFGSGAEYDKSKPIIDVREDDTKIIIPKDDYGFYKYICSNFVNNSNNIINLRLFGVYGKYENYLFKFISNTIVKNILHLPIVIKQNVFFDYLYIDDLLKIVDHFIENDAKMKVLNATRGDKIDLKSLAEIVNEVSDYKSEITIASPGMNNEYSSNNERLKKEIPGLKFTSHTQAIKILYSWYKNNMAMIDKKRILNDPYINNIIVNS